MCKNVKMKQKAGYQKTCVLCSNQAVRQQLGGTYRSGPLLSGTDTLALYCMGRGGWHWAGAFNHKLASKVPVYGRRGTFMGGANRGVRWAGVQGRRLGQRQGGQRRRGMSIQNMGNGGRWPKIKK